MSSQACADPSNLLFTAAGLGWLTFVCWWVGALLPIKRRPRFDNSSAKIAWIMNVIFSFVSAACLITIIVLYRKFVI